MYKNKDLAVALHIQSRNSRRDKQSFIRFLNKKYRMEKGKKKRKKKSMSGTPSIDIEMKDYGDNDDD